VFDEGAPLQGCHWVAKQAKPYMFLTSSQKLTQDLYPQVTTLAALNMSVVTVFMKPQSELPQVYAGYMDLTCECISWHLSTAHLL
jgi:hypothetical protein